VQRRKIGVALDLVDQLGRDALILLHRGSAANHAMANSGRSGEVAGVKRVGDQLEGNRTIGQGRRLIHQLVAAGVLDPEFAQIGADAVDRALVELAPFAVAGFIDRKLDGRRTAIQNQYRQGRHE